MNRTAPHNLCRRSRLPLTHGWLVTVLAATAVVAHAEIVAIPAPHLGDGKTLRAQLFTPPDITSDVQRPAVILLHGCGGIGARGALNPRHTMWKDWFIERGFVVVFPESFSSRGYAQVCTIKFGDRTIKQSDRVDDVLATKKWLSTRPGVNAEKLVLMGWSHGGSATLATVTRSSDSNPDPDSRFAQAIAFYPGCSSYANAKRVAPLSSPLAILMGDADDWTPAAPCERWMKRLEADRQPATIRLYQGAFHDFDAPNSQLRVRSDVPNGVNPGKGVTVGSDPLARELAKKEVELLLRAKGLIAQ